ncbi:hypothetical protein JMJ35_004891 [Cladonia borealis]|uniref:NACHT-NTPase and P-loop NTPases N-terminal domain-containing protein n=1 Tax=Cladonia borealis TaxID=184061 RepID=A0AA39R303_9LECA|nr:hypothetical protein JMJ35_004891 [Cladonia borealis]
MAEPMSIIAGISSVTSLADVSCSLAGSLYKAFRAIKDAPRAVQKLSKELEQLRDLLQNVDSLLQRYSTSLLVTEDGLSINSVQSVLQECQTELESVQKIAASFEKQPSKLKNTTTRFRWVVDERKIKQHCQTIEQLRQHLNTGLSVLSHQYDIKARERDKSLHSQVTDVRNVLDTSATETKTLISSEFGSVRSDIEQVAVKVAISQEGLQKNIQTSHEHLCQEVSHAGVQTSHGIERIQNDLRDTNLLVQRDRQHTMQEILQLNQSIRNIDSMLSQVLLLYSERGENLLECSLAQHPRLEGIMLSLLMMKLSLVSAVSELKSKSSSDISDEEIDFLLNEFENLVAFSHDASALRIRQRCIKAEGEDRPSRRWKNHTSMAGNYVLDVDSFSQPTVTRRERLRTLSHADASGILKLSFENRAGDVNGRPSSILNATFSYIPNIDIHKTGVFATFRKEMRMGLNPSINRSLRVIRNLYPNDSTYSQLRNVLQKDDLHGLQRMLSWGQIRPWDRDWDGWNLLTMTLYWADGGTKIIDYLLVDAWDIENSDEIHLAFLRRFLDFSWVSGDLDLFIQLSRRISALGQVIHAELIHDFFRLSRYFTFSPKAESIYDVLFQFLTNQGADIEHRDSFREETALLVAAEVDNLINLYMMPVLLRFGADYSAVDYKGRGPLHLALKPARRDHPGTRLHHRALKEKLVLLLQAGCSIHAIDHYGRTPTDVARKYRRTSSWKAALREVGKLECGKSECRCEIIKTEKSKSCNATLSAFGHEHGEDEDEDKDEDEDEYSPIWSDCIGDTDSEDGGTVSSEDSAESSQDGDEHEVPWIITHADEDGSQDLDMYEADSEGQDTDMDIDEDDHPSEDQDNTSNLTPDKESSQDTAPDENNLHNPTPTLPHLPESEPLPTPKSHHETIALGQHHLWMM